MPNSINSSSRHHSGSNSGFTLIELLVTIVVLAVIVSIAAPSISTQLANQRVKSTTATLINALREAKAESVIRRQPVTVVYSNDTGSSNVSIQVPAPSLGAYSNLSLFPSAVVARDWTSLFISSAVAANGSSNACDEKCGRFDFGCQLKCLADEWLGTGDKEDKEKKDKEKKEKEEKEKKEKEDKEKKEKEDKEKKEKEDKEKKEKEDKDKDEIGGGKTPEPTTPEPTTPEPTTPEPTTPEPTTPEPTTPEPTTPGSSVEAPNLISIAAYKYSAKTLINSNSTNITFYPSKRIDKAAAFTYTICDSNKSASPRQVTVNALGVISSKLGGTCE